MTLKDWMKLRNVSPEALAARIAASRATVFRALRGECSKGLAKRIETATRGEVTFAEVLQPEGNRAA